MNIVILTSCHPDGESPRAEKLRYRCKKLLENDFNPIIVKPSLFFHQRNIELQSGRITCYGNNRTGQEKADSNTNLAKSLLEKLINLFTPTDVKIVYSPTTILFLSMLTRKKKIKLINTQIFPFTNNIIGLINKYITGTPWIMEYRDPWLNNPVYYSNEPSRLNKFLEKNCVENCDLLIKYKGTQIPENYFKSKYPENLDKIAEIGYVGFDENQIENVEGKNFDKFTVIYGGTFYGNGHDPQNFFKAIEQLVSERESLLERLQFYFLGTDKKYKETAPKSIKSLIKFKHWLPPEKYFSYLKGADYGLYVNLKEEGNEMSVSGKMSDYIGCSIPVICLSKEGWNSWNLIESEEIGVVADLDNPIEIKESLLNAIENNYKVNGEIKDEFNREKNFEKYLDLINKKLVLS